MNRIIFFGPPGTGKTATLLDQMEKAMANGYDPERIAFLTFTRRARREALERVEKKFGLTPKRLPYFKTIHAVAFKALGLSEGDILDQRSLHEFGERMGLEFGVAGVGETASEGFNSDNSGDVLLAMDNMARLKGLPLKEIWRTSKNPFEWSTVDQFSESYKLHKETHGLLDFTDVLAQFAASRIELPVDIAFIDEAQDLSALQWLAALQCCARAKAQYVAGDDDQALYKWAGAEVGLFINLEGNREVLHQSYRLPKAVYRLACTVLDSIKARVPKQFKPRDAEGVVRWHAQTDSLPLDNGLDWLLLVRNRYLLPGLRRALANMCYVFSEHGLPSIREVEKEVIYDWERLRAGKRVECQRVRAIYTFLKSPAQVKRGHKQLEGVPDDLPMDEAMLRDKHGLLAEGYWYQVLNIPTDRMLYYRALLAKHKTLRLRPTIELDTIHGAKGAQAQCVGLYTDMTRRVWEEQQNDPDAEHRVWYVGITRALEQLHLVHPQGRWAYEFGTF
jgi:DNA helicase-2/ATP-dependent DNA helicase PcrA